ncbi:MAG: hypothetical protein ACLT2Z_05960 [Eubacterium sp.]
MSLNLTDLFPETVVTLSTLVVSIEFAFVVTSVAIFVGAAVVASDDGFVVGASVVSSMKAL